MFQVIQTVNPKTCTALYADEYIILGTFCSMQEAIQKIGRDFMRFCAVKTIHA